MLFNTYFSSILETQLQVRASAAVCERMDTACHEHVPFNACPLPSINASLMQSSRARVLSGINLPSASALKNSG